MCLGSQKKSQNHKGTLLPPLLATAPIFSCEWPASSMRLKRVSHQHLAFLQSQYLMPGDWYLKTSQFSARLKIGQISDPVQRVLFPQLWHVLLWPPEAPLSPQSSRQPDKPTTLPYNPDQVHPNDHDMVISISEFIGKTSNNLEYPHSSRYIAWMGRNTWDGCSHMDSPFVSFWKYFWPSSSSASQVQLLHENWHVQVRLSAAPKCISHFLIFSLYFHISYSFILSSLVQDTQWGDEHRLAYDLLNLNVGAVRCCGGQCWRQIWAAKHA